MFDLRDPIVGPDAAERNKMKPPKIRGLARSALQRIEKLGKDSCPPSRRRVDVLAAAESPSELRRQLGGHADLKSHTGYTHIENRQSAEALKRLQILKMRFFIDKYN